MKDKEQYEEYAKDCLRMAAKASGKDKEALLKMAEAWQSRVEAAAKLKVKKD
jgi:hypothetical protein